MILRQYSLSPWRRTTLPTQPWKTPTVTQNLPGMHRSLGGGPWHMWGSFNRDLWTWLWKVDLVFAWFVLIWFVWKVDIVLFDAYLFIFDAYLYIFVHIWCCSYTSDAICECRDPGPVRYFWFIFYRKGFQKFDDCLNHFQLWKVTTDDV